MTTPAAPLSSPSAGQATNVAVATWFLQAGNKQLATFKTVSGIALTLGVVELQQTTSGGQTHITKSVASGGVKPGQITCTRGLILDDSMWKWIQNVIDGDMASARTNISLQLYSAKHELLKSYTFLNAWPSGWSLGDLDSSGSDALMETLTIEHEGFTLAGFNGL